VEYKIVLKRYARSQQQPIPTDDEWSRAKSICEFLAVFEVATLAFSADRYPTSHTFLHNVLLVHQALRSQERRDDQVIEALARAMDNKFDKYWNRNYNMLLVIAAILDPRQKFDYLDFFYEKVCENLVDVNLSKNLARDCLYKYYRKYEEIVRTDINTTSQASGSSSVMNRSPVVLLGKRRLEQEFAQFSSQRRGTRIGRSELDAYLEEELVREDENFEILTWWKTNSNKYPVLSAMARDFLAIPVSTVSSESAFSLSGRILSDNRSSMTPQTLEALVCGKDWLYKHQQAGESSPFFYIPHD
jgi:hypothetical protein